MFGRTFTVSCLILLSFTSASFGQKVAADLPIPYGSRVLGVAISNDDLKAGKFQEGDVVDVISQSTGKVIARSLQVYSPSRTSDTRKHVISLVATQEQSDDIQAALKPETFVLIPASSHIGAESKDKNNNYLGDPAASLGALPSMERTGEIRNMARKIDNIAAILESLDRFDFADELRAISQKLRVSVRPEKQ